MDEPITYRDFVLAAFGDRGLTAVGRTYENRVERGTTGAHSYACESGRCFLAVATGSVMNFPGPSHVATIAGRELGIEYRHQDNDWWALYNPVAKLIDANDDGVFADATGRDAFLDLIAPVEPTTRVPKAIRDRLRRKEEPGG